MGSGSGSKVKKTGAKPTKKVGRKFREGEKVLPNLEEAIIYVWDEKHILNPDKMRPGHAAMKLKRVDGTTGEIKLVDMVDMWPRGVSDKSTKFKYGRVSSSYKQDRIAEFSKDDMVNLFITLKLYKAAMAGGGYAQKKKYKLSLRLYWQYIALNKPDMMERLLKEYKCEPNFSNLDEVTKFAVQSNHKLINVLGKKADLKGYSIKKLGAMLIQQGISAGKSPFVKIYIPCSCLPTRIDDKKDRLQRPAWGLSIDAMRHSWTLIQGRFHYEMKGETDNCIGVVWGRMKDGLGDLFIKNFKAKDGSFAKTLAHLQVKLFKKTLKPRSLVPSDAIPISEALLNRLAEMDKAQMEIEASILRHRGYIKKIMDKDGLWGGQWRRWFTKELWRNTSIGKGRRKPLKRRIDSLIEQYEKLERKLGQDEEHLYHSLVSLERNYRSEWPRIEELLDKAAEQYMKVHEFTENLKKEKIKPSKAGRNRLRKIEQGTLFGAKDKDFARVLLNQGEKKLAQLLEKKDRHLKMIFYDQKYKELSEILAEVEKRRRQRADLLIKLHDTISKFAKQERKDKLRLPPVLLLGQFVTWAFIETAHDNVMIGVHGLRDYGFMTVIEKKIDSLPLDLYDAIAKEGTVKKL
jgi:hypothetical protein